jgi:hypothetical protein
MKHPEQQNKMMCKKKLIPDWNEIWMFLANRQQQIHWYGGNLATNKKNY